MSLQSSVPSPSLSTSGTPQPQTPGACLLTSLGQPSRQSFTPSPSLSGQLHTSPTHASVASDPPASVAVPPLPPPAVPPAPPPPPLPPFLMDVPPDPAAASLLLPLKLEQAPATASIQPHTTTTPNEHSRMPDISAARIWCLRNER